MFADFVFSPCKLVFWRKQGAIFRRQKAFADDVTPLQWSWIQQTAAGPACFWSAWSLTCFIWKFKRYGESICNYTFHLVIYMCILECICNIANLNFKTIKSYQTLDKELGLCNFLFTNQNCYNLRNLVSNSIIIF